ncbi:uncharacterized protein N7511_007674 [Penicillium nucicola]|uniref:uncharacterized protein n=1 Tax=Penicillium nucicola TaxID=1850975 RepID=UPI0025455DAC|nr:uncharacterized protein N7511_007674 [Penicillium nucicola]KAJ5753521.1 hypothetical protein N7511_007674 [Penicillium nucicola]
MKGYIEFHQGQLSFTLQILLAEGEGFLSRWKECYRFQYRYYVIPVRVLFVAGHKNSDMAGIEIAKNL